MDFQNCEPALDGCGAFLDYPAKGGAETAATGLSRAVFQALADPVVQMLMAADRVDPKELEELLRRVAAQLCERPDRWRFL